jgi:exportin-2 (importin alpha re-exporter)
MADLASILLASLQPQTRQQAEQTLDQFSNTQPQFFVQLLRLVLDPSQTQPVRLSASIYFKNTVKRRWDDEQTDTPIPGIEKRELKADLLPAMITLSGPATKSLRAQLAESIAIIAACDFPLQWDTLIDVRFHTSSF